MFVFVQAKTKVGLILVFRLRFSLESVTQSKQRGIHLCVGVSIEDDTRAGLVFVVLCLSVGQLAITYVAAWEIMRT